MAAMEETLVSTLGMLGGVMLGSVVLRERRVCEMGSTDGRPSDEERAASHEGDDVISKVWWLCGRRGRSACGEDAVARDQWPHLPR